MTDKERLEEIKCILESPGEVFFGDISSEGNVSQDVADAEPYFLWMVKRIDELEQQNKRYREALEFYADRENYDEEMIGSTLISGSKVMYEEGQIARKALEGEE